MCYVGKRNGKDKVVELIQCSTSTPDLRQRRDKILYRYLFSWLKGSNKFLRSASLLKSTSFLLRYDCSCALFLGYSLSRFFLLAGKNVLYSSPKKYNFTLFKVIFSFTISDVNIEPSALVKLE